MSRGYSVKVSKGFFGGFVARVRYDGQHIITVSAPTEAKAYDKANRAIAAEEGAWRKHSTRRGWVWGHSIEVD